MAAGGGMKAIIAAFLANLAIAVAKFIGFLVTSSSSMLAESIHSVADTSNQGLLMLGHRRSRRGATDIHQFGYGRERYFWSFVVAIVLFFLGSAFATFEGIEKIRHPHEIESVYVAIIILVVGIIFESGSFLTAIREANLVRGGRGWVEFIRHSRAPELPVVVLEDFGALIGLVIAMVAVGMSRLTEEPVWDGIGTVLIGLLLGAIAIVLAVEMKSLLIGESATAKDRLAIRQALSGTEGVRRIIHKRTQHIGPEEILVAAKLEFAPDMDVREIAATIDRAEAAVRAAVPAATLIYIEPDLYRGER